LRRFWFPLTHGYGIGVYRPRRLRARELAEDVRARYFANAEITGQIADVDVSTLDANHVAPNLGFVVAHGVCSPPEYAGC
jgi:hypothetical protein